VKRIAVTGMGKVGSLVGTLLADMFTVTGIDKQAPAAPVNFTTVEGNVADPDALRKLLTGQDAVVSCLPLNWVFIISILQKMWPPRPQSAKWPKPPKV
jgi:saccharopine dehydrogenase-like NADP-dependent oxidoreductase